jgi:hypothetical protein
MTTLLGSERLGWLALARLAATATAAGLLLLLPLLMLLFMLLLFMMLVLMLLLLLLLAALMLLPDRGSPEGATCTAAGRGVLVCVTGIALMAGRPDVG